MYKSNKTKQQKARFYYYRYANKNKKISAKERKLKRDIMEFFMFYYKAPLQKQKRFGVRVR